MPKLTDDDRIFGPLTLGRCHRGWRPLRVVFSSGGNGDCDKADNSLTVYAFGWIAALSLPNILQPYRIKHQAMNWDAATVARIGRDWYYETHSREYGFSLSDGFLQIFLGPQTHDSDTTKNWCCHLPWTQWRFVRFSLYNPDGSHYWTQYEHERRRGFDSYDDQRAAEESCPSVAFEFDDHDAERIKVRAQIHEREWLFGAGWFKWLSLFRKPKVCRSLDLRFGSEVGPEKGSWKGGTTGHSIEMQAGESCETAFRRYCEQEHRSKYRPFKIKFVGVAA